MTGAAVLDGLIAEVTDIYKRLLWTMFKPGPLGRYIFDPSPVDIEFLDASAA